MTRLRPCSPSPNGRTRTTALATSTAWLRHCAAGLLALLGLTTQAPGAPATPPYPQRPVTLIVPTSAGGGTDAVARVLADALGQALHQPFVVDNRPGANGLLGNALAARAAPDGYHLLFTYAATMVVNPMLYKKPGYDPLRDFEPVMQIGRGGTLLVVSARLPVHTVAEFLAYGQAHPRQLSYCSWGQGSGGHLAMASLMQDTGLDLVHVPYKGSAACINDLLAGQVSAAFADASLALELVRQGRLRALALSAETRLPALPQVPTLTESGHPFTAYSWLGLFAPAGTPAAIVNQLNSSLNEAFQNPAVRQRLARLQLTELPPITPTEFRATLTQDLAEWRRLVLKPGLKAE